VGERGEMHSPTAQLNEDKHRCEILPTTSDDVYTPYGQAYSAVEQDHRLIKRQLLLNNKIQYLIHVARARFVRVKPVIDLLQNAGHAPHGVFARCDILCDHVPRS
jgi:hypothetical protein